MIIIIKKEIQEQCNALAKEYFDRTGGEHTFTVGLSDDGENITHFWAGFKPDQEKGEMIKQMALGFGDAIQIFEGKTAQEVLEITNLQPLHLS
jgi:hypothetical protein